MELLICVVVTYFVINYLCPLLDLCFEWIKYKISDSATSLQLNAQRKVKEFEKEFPEIESHIDAVGFHMPEPVSEFDDDDEEEEEDCKSKVNKIGFHK